jgi:hypothetical protein
MKKILSFIALFSLFIMGTTTNVMAQDIQEPPQAEDSFNPIYNNNIIDYHVENLNSDIKSIVDSIFPGLIENLIKNNVDTKYEVAYLDLQGNGNESTLVRIVNNQNCTDDFCTTILFENGKVIFVSDTENLALGQINKKSGYAILVDKKTIWEYVNGSYDSSLNN